MAVANKVIGKTYVNSNEILIAPELAFTAGCLVSNSGVTADENGRKIIKAGTPVAGDIVERTAAFTKTNGNTATAVVLHDVDVTAGDENATIVISGYVDLLKLDAETAALITSDVKGALSKVVFMKGNK